MTKQNKSFSNIDKNNIVQELVKNNLRLEDISIILNVNADIITSWQIGKDVPSDYQFSQLIELLSLMKRLSQIIKSEFISAWLYSQIPVLNDERPIDLLQEKRYVDISRLISELEYPGVI